MKLEVRRLEAAEAREHLPALAGVLLDCVKGGASVGFMAALTHDAAEEFFAQCIEGVAQAQRILLAAFLGSELVGTVQVVPAAMPNQSHRADVAKLLVRRSARGQGVAAALMTHAEQESLRAGRTVMVLDTVTGSVAERLYLRLGWTKAGVIPDYALFPDGSFCSTTFFWKKLG